MTNKEWLNNLTNKELLEWLNSEYKQDTKMTELLAHLERKETLYKKMLEQENTDVILAKYDTIVSIKDFIKGK